MATMTLLEIVQNILSAIDSDSVNSIDDTVESDQVATIVKETYFDIITQRDWPFLRTKFSLTGLGDTDNPTKMRIPTNYNKLLWVRYNKKEVSYMDPKEFQEMLDARELLASVVDADGFILNRDPVYFTSFDDDYLTFDGYDSTTESTLTGANTTAYGVLAPAWTHEDSFTPFIPDKMFPVLLADAKATCFLNLKQQANAREERRAQRGRVRMQNEAWKTNDAEGKWNTIVNYGRK
jgi:hypothetical protein